jgi:hypothetical protein
MTGRSQCTFCLHFAAYAFHFAEDPQQISAENLADVVCAVAAVEHRLRDLAQVGGGIYSLRQGAAYAVEVRTQAGVIDPCNLGDVVDVIDQGLERRARKLGGPFPLDLVFVQIG